MTQDHKYLLKLIEQEKSIEGQNENIPRFARGVYDPNILKHSSLQA